MTFDSSLVTSRLNDKLEIILLLAIVTVILAIIKSIIGHVPTVPTNLVIGQSEISDLELQQFL